MLDDQGPNTSKIRKLLNSAFDDAGLDAFCQDYFPDVYDRLSRGMRKDEKITLLLDHCRRTMDGFRALLQAVQIEHEALPQRDDLKLLVEAIETLLNILPQPARLFICYKRQASPDQQLALYLHDILTTQGHEVFIDESMRTGEAWMEKIDQQIKASDFLIVLLSEASADSEMVKAEVKRAYDYRELQGKPQTLPIRIAYEGLLPYAIAAFVDPLQYMFWQSESDNDRVVQELLAAMKGYPLRRRLLRQASSLVQTQIISEDGRLATDDETPHPPLPEFDPRLIDELAVPGGPVRIRDRFYVEREADIELKELVVKWGTTTTIRAPRQTGKTSLLIRGINHAKQNGAKVVLLDFQQFGGERLNSPDIFLRELAEIICRQLRLDTSSVAQAWQGTLGAQQKLTYFFEDDVLPKFETPIILAMDEADSLLRTDFYKDFFGLVRAWCTQQALNPDQWEKLNIVMIISTEPYLLINDINQSPFNVGTTLELTDFTVDQVQDLNYRHGSPVTRTEFPHLMELLDGQPYLTRKALYNLVKHDLTWSELARNAATDQGAFADHLKRHHWGLRDQPELKKALKEIIQSNRCSDDTSLLRLLRAGLIKGGGSYFTCRCGLYRLYFEDKL